MDAKTHKAKTFCWAVLDIASAGAGSPPPSYLVHMPERGGNAPLIRGPASAPGVCAIFAGFRCFCGTGRRALHRRGKRGRREVDGAGGEHGQFAPRPDAAGASRVGTKRRWRRRREVLHWRDRGKKREIVPNPAVRPLVPQHSVPRSAGDRVQHRIIPRQQGDRCRKLATPT